MTTPTTGDPLGLNATLAMTIRRLRKRRGLRQTDLAETLGWPVSRVTRVEGERPW
jgi:transcriptional regulator with XRE-family HTH domain